jgi:hypothetical protein
MKERGARSQTPTIRDAIRLAAQAGASRSPVAFVKRSKATPETQKQALDILIAQRSPRQVP